MSVLGKARLT